MRRFLLLTCSLLAVAALVFGQSETFQRWRLSAGTSITLAEVDSTGHLLVSATASAAPASGDATTFQRVRLAGGTTGNLAEVDSTGHLLVAGETIARGTSAMGTGAIGSGACATAVTTAATGTLTTDVITAGFNGDPTGVTGYVPLSTGMLTIIAYPSADNVNFKVCNNSSGSITPGALTLNWRVAR